MHQSAAELARGFETERRDLARQGQIVFVNSSQGLQARANTSLYAATKHALKALADGLRQEINAGRIRVLSVYFRSYCDGQNESLVQG